MFAQTLDASGKELGALHTDGLEVRHAMDLYFKSGRLLGVAMTSVEPGELNPYKRIEPYFELVMSAAGAAMDATDAYVFLRCAGTPFGVPAPLDNTGRRQSQRPDCLLATKYASCALTILFPASKYSTRAPSACFAESWPRCFALAIMQYPTRPPTQSLDAVMTLESA